MQSAKPLFDTSVDQAVIQNTAFPAHAADQAYCFHPIYISEENCTITVNKMRNFEFTLALSAQKIRSIYEGQARYILVESDNGLKLQLPAANFRSFVTDDGIQGRFSVSIDANNKIQALRRI